MNSIFSPAECESFQRRIDSLSKDTKAQWGKMNVSQMLEHCQAPLNVALNRHELPKYNFIFRLIGKMVKKSLVKDETPYKHNQPTDKSFVTVNNTSDFETEKAKLKQIVSEFSEAGRTGKLGPAHPFFGPLTPNEWDMMQWKHLDHHLRQFGV